MKVGNRVNTAKTKREHSQETLKRIREASARLFVAHGYHGTSIAAIAKETGLTKGALYCHYKSKSDLLLDLIKIFEVDFLDPLIACTLADPGNALDKLHCFVTFTSRYAAENREFCLFLTIISAEFTGSGSNEFELELRRVYAKYARFLRRVVEEGKIQGLIHSELDTHTLAYVLIAIHDGVLLTWQRSREFLEGSEFVHNFRHMVFHGVQGALDVANQNKTNKIR